MNPPEEIDAIVRGFLTQQARAAADQRRPLRRGTHAKGLCVRARFEVLDLAAAKDEELAARLAVGVFARPGTYPAVARFANSDPTINSDWQPDVRGLSFSVDLSASRQDSEPLASGRKNPSFTKVLESRSNSRVSSASEPPRDKDTRQRR